MFGAPILQFDNSGFSFQTSGGSAIKIKSHLRRQGIGFDDNDPPFFSFMAPVAELLWTSEQCKNLPTDEAVADWVASAEDAEPVEDLPQLRVYMYTKDVENRVLGMLY
jgi:hypothetical protein